MRSFGFALHCRVADQQQARSGIAVERAIGHLRDGQVGAPLEMPPKVSEK